MLKLNNTTDRILAGVLIVGIVFVGYTIFNNKTGGVNTDKTKNSNNSKIVAKNNIIKNQELIKGGKVWVEFNKKELKAGDNFEVKIYADTAGEKLGVFNISFIFEPSDVSIDLKKGNNGFIKGNDVAKYLINVNIEECKNGICNFAGIKASKQTSGNKVYLGKFNLRAKKDFSIDTNFTWLKINELTNGMGKSFDISYLQSNTTIK